MPRRFELGLSGGRRFVLATLMFLYVVTAWQGFVHLDLTRDARVALDISDGLFYPLLGPILAGQVHLGSGWYYLLALLFSIGGGWLGAMIALSLLASLQFPLAYLAGKAWHSRAAGLLWAILLLLPSWSTFEQVFPTHTQLTAAATLATLLCLLRFLNRGKRKYLLCGTLAFSLALHAHPSALILVIPFGVAAATGWRRRWLGKADFTLLVVVAITPFAPLMLDQWLNGFSLLSTIEGYAHSEEAQATIGNAPALVWQISAGGTQYWLTAMLGLDKTIGWVVAITVATATIASLLLVMVRAKRGDIVGAFAIILLVLGLLLLVSIRKHFPYYMTTAFHVSLLGAVAVGMASMPMQVQWQRWAVSLVAAFCVGPYIHVWFKIGDWQRDGVLPFAIFPLFDVNSEWQPRNNVAMMPAHAMAKSGNWLCAQGGLSIHGAYGVHLIHDYALEMRLGCPRQLVSVGGENTEHRHWIGLSRNLAQRLDVVPDLEIGGFSLLPVRRVLSKARGVPNPTTGGYPPVVTDSKTERAWRLSLTPLSGDRIAISNLSVIFLPFPEVRVTVGGHELLPAAEDWMTKVYLCVSCDGQQWHIELTSASPEFIDIVSF